MYNVMYMHMLRSIIALSMLLTSRINDIVRESSVLCSLSLPIIVVEMVMPVQIRIVINNTS